MRKDIETLAKWYIPAFFLSLIISFLTSIFLKAMVMEFSTPESVLLLLLTPFIKIDHLVVAIWLYYQAKRNSGRKWIWALFGFVAHLFAAVFYLGLKIYEERNETFNKRLNSDAE